MTSPHLRCGDVIWFLTQITPQIRHHGDTVHKFTSRHVNSCAELAKYIEASPWHSTGRNGSMAHIDLLKKIMCNRVTEQNYMHILLNVRYTCETCAISHRDRSGKNDLVCVLSKLINYLNLSLAFGHHDTAPTVVDVRLWVLYCLVAIVT